MLEHRNQNVKLTASSSLFSGPPRSLVTTGGGTCTVNNSNVICTWATIPYGTTDTVTIAVAWLSAVGSVCDSATVGAGTPDPNLTNNSSNVCAAKK